MKNKNILIAVGIAIIILAIIYFASKSSRGSLPSINTVAQTATSSDSSIPNTAAKSSQNYSKQPISKTVSKAPVANVAISNLPNTSFIDQRTLFPLKNFPNVKVTVEDVAFGRGDAIKYTGCNGLPGNDFFKNYLYPGNVCINETQVDGSPMAIAAFRILIENNGNIGFGSNSDILKLHYLRSDSTGTPSFRFAHPLIDMGSYYVDGYSSKEVTLSYLVPQDQLIFDLVSGYKEPYPLTNNFNVYDYSVDGLLVNFNTLSLKVVK